MLAHLHRTAIAKHQTAIAKHQSFPGVLASVKIHCKSWLTPKNQTLLESVENALYCSRARRSHILSTRGHTDRRFSQCSFHGHSTKQRKVLQLHQTCAYSTGPDRKRVRQLMIATYVSGVIGGLLLVAIAYRFYGRFKRRARGIEEVDVPLFGRRNRLFCRYRGYILPSDIVETVVNEIPWFDVRPEDTWVVSFPKAGTTWLQEIVYLICNDYDYEKAKATTIEDRFPFLEFPYPGVKVVAQSPSPRFIKTHLPFSLLPKQMGEKKPKVIYIARNPKDTAVSLLAFTKLISYVHFHGNMEDFAQLFMEGTVFYGPWDKHVKEAWEHRDQENVLFITYEDLHKDFRGTVKDIARFLDKPLSESQLTELEAHCSFGSMQSNNSVNYSWQQGVLFGEGQFLRKGKVGDWKNHLSPETSAKFDTMLSTLEPFGIHFVDS